MAPEVTGSGAAEGGRDTRAGVCDTGGSAGSWFKGTVVGEDWGRGVTEEEILEFVPGEPRFFFRRLKHMMEIECRR